MNEFELNSEFKKFKEITETIIITEYHLNHFIWGHEDLMSKIETLKFVCLKYGICDVDELENLSEIGKDHVIKFCEELKINYCIDFLEKISD